MNQQQMASPQQGGGIMKWLLIILAVIIVLGGGYWLNIKYGKGTPSPTASPSPTISAKVSPSTSAVVSPTESINADWKTYTNSTYNFSFEYPKTWTVSEKTDALSLLSLRLYPISDENKFNDSDYTGSGRMYLYESLKKLDTNNLNPSSLKDYLDKYSNLSDPIYTKYNADTIGGKSGYTATMGPNQFGGGGASFIQLSDGKIFQIRIYDTGGDDQSFRHIFETLKFN